MRDRHRIVNQRLDAAAGQMLLQRLASARLGADDEQMVDVAGVAFGRHVDRRAGEAPAVARGQRRRRSVQPRSRGSRARRIAACISSRRELTPGSP